MRLYSKLLAGAALLALCTGTAAADTFEKSAAYPDGKFTDIGKSDWYYSEVIDAYELGFINGTSEKLFSPDDNLSLAQAVTLASRVSATAKGETIPADISGEWYMPYVNYAASKGFFTYDANTDFERPAARKEVAELFYKALPAEYFAKINDVAEIPDVPKNSAEYDNILALYNAGVVMGSDSFGNFFPENSITRAETAAIINRVALPENRQKKVLDKVSHDDAYGLIITDSMNGYYDGIDSGWALDNRGAYPKFKLMSDYSSIGDTRTEEGTALIRYLNDVASGVVELEIKFNLIGNPEGFYIALNNSDGNSVYKTEVKDGAFMLKLADGSSVKLAEAQAKTYLFTLFIDLDNGRCKTLVDRKEIGTYPLLTNNDETFLSELRIATTEESLAAATIKSVYADVNYAVNENGMGYYNEIPYDWTVNGAVIDAKEKFVFDAGGSAVKYFNPVSGIIVAEAEFVLDKKQNITFALTSGTKNVVTFTSDAEKLYANGTCVYDYVPNIWYRVRIEADTASQTALILINGIKAGEVAFSDAATSASAIAIINGSSDSVSFDNIKVFRKFERDDYVPEPVIPKGTEKYNVGINICSLWRNGEHFDWACITPYEEPVLGYYDEGVPETADWEIKYMVEHGIDFQAFCWFSDATNSPIKTPRNAFHLHDGYKNAKYSDKMKYCLLWEAVNGAIPKDLDAWKNYYVPYFIEHYFKDPRYMTVDNNLLFYVFGATKLTGTNSFGHADKVKEAFDYMEEEVKKLGFDGVIYISVGTSNSTMVQMGFEGASAYSWSRDGYKIEANQKGMNEFNSVDGIYGIPTISVGFSGVAWMKSRTPLMTVEDFGTVSKWVKDDFIPNNAEKDTWQDGLVMLSTWNEYGEGTYIMPCENNGGFGYLDALRETFTDEKADASLNTVPTTAQKERITHLYPQDHKLLRRLYLEDIEPKAYEIVSSADLLAEDVKSQSVEGFLQSMEGVSGTGKGDAMFWVKPMTKVNCDEAKLIIIKGKIPQGDTLHTFFKTTKANAYNAATSYYTNKSQTNESQTYILDYSDNELYGGELLELRVDPVANTGSKFVIESVEFAKKVAPPPSVVSVNGAEFELDVPCDYTGYGETLLPFDPAGAMDFIIGAYHTWDAEKHELTLYLNKHIFVFTKGNMFYTVDGQKVELGYELYEKDGLPVLPILMVAKDAGFECTQREDGVLEIVTPQKDFFEKITSRRAGAWEFDIVGDFENWESSHMSFTGSSDGYITLDSITESTDPVVWYRGKDKLVTEKYTALEIRVRYKYGNKDTKPTNIGIYFTTNKDGAWSESKFIGGLLNSTDSEGEWETYTYDLTKMPTWNGTVAAMRFDPFNAKGTIDVDYIRFIEDPDYIPPEQRPIEIKNGDAEDTSNITFYSHNGNVSIVQDPDNKKNHCYQILSKGGKAYVYALHDVYLKAGKTYKVEYDLKLAALDSSTDIDDITAYINCNFRYTDSGGKVDHVVKSTAVSDDDGWVHVSFTYTLGSISGEYVQGAFSLYSNPVKDLGVGYYLDNIVVTEVK